MYRWFPTTQSGKAGSTMNTLSARIKRKMPEFSKGQRLIANYIEQHCDTVAFMTASKLGATVGVSESTVVRFATEIGYAGYPELQRAMQEMIRSKMTSLQRLEMTQKAHGSTTVLEPVFQQDIELIRRTMEEIPREAFERATDAIAAANRVYIIGARSSSALAAFLSYYFHLVLDNVQLVNVTSEEEMFEQMIRIDEQDAVIGISFPRYSRRAVRALQFASSRGATVVSITDSETSPIAESADCLLLARSDMVSFVDSLVAPLSLVNALIVSTAAKKKAEVEQVLTKLEEIWEECRVYEKVDEASN